MKPKYDAIIIGAGIGGLIAGNYLARKGVKTLIYEQHQTPGGYVCGFKRKGFYFDGGAQSFPSCGLLFPILKELGLLERLKFKRAYHRFVLPGIDVTTESWQGFQNAFIEAFPEFREELAGFFGELSDVMKVIGLFSNDTGMALLNGTEKFMKIFSIMKDKQNREAMMKMGEYSKVSAADFIGSRLKGNQKLRDFFTRLCYQDVSLMAYAGMWHCYLNDYWYPEIGLQEFSNLLADSIRMNGGILSYGTLIKRVMVKKGKAVGVVTGDNQEIGAKYVISAGDYLKLFQQMTGEKYAPKNIKFQLAKPAVSETFATLFLGLKTRAEELDKILRVAHVYYYPGYELFLKEDDENYFQKAGLGISAPSLHNPALSDQGKASLVIQTFAPYNWMNRWGAGPNLERTETYRSLKQRVVSEMVATLERFIPGIKEEIEVMELATPLTMERYTLNSFGASAGWSWDSKKAPVKMGRFSLKTPIKNLFTCGHWTAIPAGVPSAALTGRMAAKLVK
ncbi:MAG: phytoene desaturase family protein [Bacteroidota bacterium]